jgi:peptidoglycan/xylan/chitin deacetylase (PgdA/CDA1 family)
MNLRGLMLLAAITLGLCGVVFGMWGIRQYKTMKIDVETLKKKRIELIDYLKDANLEITTLKSELDSLRRAGMTAANPNNKKAALTSEILIASAKSLKGLPLSFDNGDIDSKIVALTFDGGSLSNAADDILDTLKSRNVKATVFLSGNFIRAFPDVVKRIAADRHETGNHTFSHPHLTAWAQDRTHTTLPGVSASFLCQELSRTDALYCLLTGSHLSPIWRAPYGEKNRSICEWAQECGYLHIGWRQGKSWRQGLDSNDWIEGEETPGFHSPEEVLKKIMDIAQEQPHGISGGIILMHLGTVRKDTKTQIHRSLGKLIDDLRGLGYSFATVSEMLKNSGVNVELLGGKNLTGN